jgi:hypothetical protein
MVYAKHIADFSADHPLHPNDSLSDLSIPDSLLALELRACARHYHLGLAHNSQLLPFRIRNYGLPYLSSAAYMNRQ